LLKLFSTDSEIILDNSSFIVSVSNFDIIFINNTLKIVNKNNTCTDIFAAKSTKNLFGLHIKFDIYYIYI
jgi:hypothetical protein